MVARGSCDRHLCRKRPPEELFHGRKRLLRPALMSQEASGGVVLRSQETLTQLYCIRSSCDRKTSPPEASCDRQITPPEASCDRKTSPREKLSPTVERHTVILILLCGAPQ